MPDHVEKTIAELQEKISRMESEVLEQKELVNQLARHAGLRVPYPEADNSIFVILDDTFRNHSLHDAIKGYLEIRKHNRQGPAVVAEIYEGLQEGGYPFESKNEQNAKRIIRITLARNPETFRRLPQGQFGLVEGYSDTQPTTVKPKPTRARPRNTRESGNLRVKAPRENPKKDAR